MHSLTSESPHRCSRPRPRGDRDAGPGDELPPFAHGRWLYVHNGYIAEYGRLRRDTVLAVRPDLFPEIRGTHRLRIEIYLALTFGLEGDPIGGLERMAGFVEAFGDAAGVVEPLQIRSGLPMERACTPRATPVEGRSTRCTPAPTRSPCASSTRSRGASHTSPGARVVVSEPVVALPGLWHEVPAARR